MKSLMSFSLCALLACTPLAGRAAQTGDAAAAHHPPKASAKPGAGAAKKAEKSQPPGRPPGGQRHSAAATRKGAERSAHPERKGHAHGDPQRGKASFYSHRFAGKRMADGTRLDPDSNAAASKTLPLGTRARVENLHNGKSAEVEIRDRGPHQKGRIIDVSPATARQLGMGRHGVAPVEVTPIKAPDDAIGSGTRDAGTEGKTAAPD